MDDLLMLATIHDDTGNMLNMQHKMSNCRKDGIIQTSLVMVLIKIKGPAHMDEGGNHFRKRLQPPLTHQASNAEHWYSLWC